MARRENGAGTEPKQDINGRWWLKVSYRDIDTDDLKRTTIRGASQKEVLNKKKEFLKSLDAGVKPTAKKITLEEWVKTWLEINKKMSVANTTYNKLQSLFNYQIKGTVLGKMTLDKIKRSDLQKFLNEKGEIYSPGFVAGIKAVIIEAFSIAEMDKIILHNPCKNLKLPREKKPEISPLTPEEINILLKTASSGSTMYNIIFFALYTGMRRGEICGLRWADVDFSKKQITVKQQAKNERTDKPYVAIGCLKTKSAYRIIPISNRLIEMLKWHQAQQNKLKKDFYSGYVDLDLVFCQSDGKAINPNILSSQFYRLMKKTPIPSRNFHQLRHTFASTAISQGYNIKAISAILGHAKTSMTLDTYGHLMPGDVETVIEGVSAYYRL